MEGIQRIEVNNLTLKVDRNYDYSKLNLDEWDDYLNCLCQNRKYQKEAIKNALIYLMSGKYSSINQLALENFNKNTEIKEKYDCNFSKMEKDLPLPNMLSATIDLATGTGKSYVIFAIAYISMCLGYVKRVLVLCPSTTIETGLNEKFRELLSREDLRNLVPQNCINKDFCLLDANSTINEYSICIENIHTIYENTGSSIKDSFFMCGQDTLVLSDEVHHAYNTSGKDGDIRKWKSFILNPEYNFKAHLGFTGTAYIENQYFTDVIYRYSLRQAIDDRFVKKIKYVAEDEDKDEDIQEKFQKIYTNHLKNKLMYANVKPLTIMITKDIDKAEGLREDLIDFLEKKLNLSRETIENQVLIVTSSPKHKLNLQKLKDVDSDNSPVEWIISVSMLTEGWDVKNVFQIVPWEDRAFNSKLLISQVLGRGLRIPFGMPQPEVLVFNHASWSKNITSIVDEVLENETALTSFVTKSERSKYNFDLYTLNYEKEEQEKFNENYSKTENFDINKTLFLVTEQETITRKTKFENTSCETDERIYTINRTTRTVDEVVDRIVRQFKSRKNEALIRNKSEDLVFEDGKTELDKLPTAEEIKKYILEQMKNAGIQGDRLTETNIQKIYGKFTGLLRKKRTSAGFVRKANGIIKFNTDTMNTFSQSYSSMKNGGFIFYPSNFETDFDDGDKEMLNFFLDEIPRKQYKEINVYNFKTPLDIIIVNKEPEKKFVELLFEDQIAQKVDGWIKSRDVGFYSIQYILQRGQSPNQFNPDFFIKIGKYIIVIEVKADGDVSKENFSKYEDAKKHFKLLNQELEKNNIDCVYKFNMLTPESYPYFKQSVIDGTYFTSDFYSKLESDLEEKIKTKDYHE